MWDHSVPPALVTVTHCSLSSWRFQSNGTVSDDKGQIDSRGYRRTARVSEPAWEMREGFPEGKHFPDGGRSQTKDCEMGRTTIYSRI